jgi:nitrite reductase/ring-hydroxylating ferredoxin subunit
VEQTYQPPGDIWFEFVAGRHRAVKVHSQLRPHDGGTEVTETYYLPWLPNWGVLRRLIGPLVSRQVDKVWDEDLQVGVCIGGWPGVPDQPARNGDEPWRRPLSPGEYRVGAVTDFTPGSLVAVETPGGRVVIAHTHRGLRALHATCPHTGGPLELGRLKDGCIRCPWHGAQFDVDTGTAGSGPTRVPLACYETRDINGQLIVRAGV